jgi:hypothetical protein
MANEQRLIDANALDEKLEILKVRFKAQGRNSVVEDYNFVQTVLMTAPTVDAVEVVRCKDCKHFVQSEPYDPCECMKWTIKWGVAYTQPNGFCSYGEGREGE